MKYFLEKRAFTLVELVFVIVILGIMSSVAIGRFSTESKLRLATEQVIRHINYTKHLAMIDDKYTPVPESSALVDIKNSRYWYKRNWTIFFGYRTIDGTTHRIYTIMSDSPSTANDSEFNGTPTISEIALDPHSRKYLSFHSQADPDGLEEIDLTETYNITNVDFANSCDSGGNRLTFDYIGRPYNGFDTDIISENPYEVLHPINVPCLITLTHANEGNGYICVEPVTGYVREVDSAGDCS